MTATDAVGGGECILVVEDDERVRRLVVRRLERLGYAVIETADGASALQLLRADKHVDLLFTDIVMAGGMSGFELAQKAQRLRPALKILLTSGYADPALLGRRRRLRNAGWIGKPYSSTALQAKLREMIGR